MNVCEYQPGSATLSGMTTATTIKRGQINRTLRACGFSFSTRAKVFGRPGSFTIETSGLHTTQIADGVTVLYDCAEVERSCVHSAAALTRVADALRAAGFTVTVHTVIISLANFDKDAADNGRPDPDTLAAWGLGANDVRRGAFGTAWVADVADWLKVTK